MFLLNELMKKTILTRKHDNYIILHLIFQFIHKLKSCFLDFINNILKILPLQGLDKNGVEKLVKEEKIRDAVTFQEEASDANNHFVKLIINGEKRESNGLGSGANPRTAIGQKADGTVLLLVTDGRGASGHLGATASDLIEVMEKYGAINAANLDGGSSSTMYYEDKYLMTSVTLYYSNSSWRLPEAFIIEK